MTITELVRRLNLTEANLRKKLNKLYVVNHEQFKTKPELLDVLLTKKPDKILKSCTVKELKSALKLLNASGSGNKSSLIDRILEKCESNTVPEDGPAFNIFSLLSANPEQNTQGFVLFESLPSEVQIEVLSHTTVEQRNGKSVFSPPGEFSLPPFFIWKLHLLANSESFQNCTKMAIDVYENCFDQNTLQMVAKRCQHVTEMRMYFLSKNSFVADDFPSQLSNLYTEGILNEKYIPFIANIPDIEVLTVIGSGTDSSLPYYDEVRLKLDEVIGKYDTYEYMLLNRVAHIEWTNTFPSLKSLTIKDSNKILTITLNLPKLEHIQLENLSYLRTITIGSEIKGLSFTTCPCLQTFYLNTNSLIDLSIDRIHGGFASETHLKSNNTITKFFETLSNDRIYFQAQGEIFRGQLDDSSPYYEKVKDYFVGNSEYVEDTPLEFQWEGGIYIFSKAAFFKVLMSEIQTQSVPEEWQKFRSAYCIQECGVDLDRYDEDGLDLVGLTCNYWSEISGGDNQLLEIDSPVFHDYQTVRPLYAVLNSVINQVFWQVWFQDRKLETSDIGDPLLISFGTQGWLSCYSAKEVQLLLDAVKKYQYPLNR